MKTLTQADTRKAIHAQIATLTTQINKLIRCMQAKTYKTASLMISGRTPMEKEFHDIIVWNRDLEIPVDRLVTFINDYASDLIAERLRLEGALKDPPTAAVPLGGVTRTAHCPYCNKVTTQEYHRLLLGETETREQSLTVPLWVCAECTGSQFCEHITLPQ